MIALIQRVLNASVRVNGSVIAQIDIGLLVFVAFKPHDVEATVERLLLRTLNYRVFADDGAKINRSLRDIGADLLLVPQFTLAADTRRGLRPGFSTAAPVERARSLFHHLITTAAALLPGTQSGTFGADMQVALVNDGPVTLWLEN